MISTGPKKFVGWNDDTDHSIIMQNLVEIERRMSAWETKRDVFTFYFYFFVYNDPEITIAGDLVALLQQEIALVFVGRFRCGLKRFFSGKKSPFLSFPLSQRKKLPYL